MTKPTHVLPVNASALKMLVCPQRYAFRVQHGLKPQVVAEALSSGKAVHQFAEYIEQGDRQSVAEMKVRALATTLPDKFFDIATKYMIMRQRLPDPIVMPTGVKMVEYFFNYPWITLERKHAFYEIHICGTMDRICFKDGKIRIIDIKTTKKQKEDEIFDAYAASVQFYFYQWVIQEWGESLFYWDKELFAAVQEDNIVTHILMCQVYSGKWLLGNEIYHTPTKMAQWKKEFLRSVEALVDSHDAQREAQAAGKIYETPRTGLINDQCGYCDYVPLCHAPDKATEMQNLAMGFVYDEYNPSKF